MYARPKTTPLVLVACLMIGTLQVQSADLNGGEEKTFAEVRVEIESAIEARNFHDAIASLDVLLPIIKRDIKKSKKHLVELEKSDNPEMDPTTYSADIDKKAELYESIKTYSGISSTAFRVKADKLVTLIDEYNKLVDNS